MNTNKKFFIKQVFCQISSSPLIKKPHRKPAPFVILFKNDLGAKEKEVSQVGFNFLMKDSMSKRTIRL